MRKQLLFLFTWLGMAAAVSAQQVPSFLAYNEQNQVVETFCVGQRITFRDNTGETNVTEFYDFDANNGLDFSAKETAFTFTTPGTYRITQLKGVGNFKERTFDVKAAEPASAPVLQKLTLELTGLRLQIQSGAINDLVVEQANSSGGSFTAIATLRAVAVGQSEHTVPLASPSGCFRVRVTNLCTGKETITSTTVCTQPLQVTAGDRRNPLSWAPNASMGAVTNYQLLRGGQPYQNLSGTQTTFTDEQVACGRIYTYQLVALLPNGSQSVSLTVQVTTQGTTPPAPPQLVVSFTPQNRLVATTVAPAQETFKEQALYRSQGGGVFSLISEKQPGNALDPSFSSFSPRPCYQTTYTDSCSLTSARSNTACPAILTARLQPEGGVQLSWEPYEGFTAGNGSQTLELVDEQGSVYWSTQVTGRSYLDLQPPQKFQRLHYRLLSQSQDQRQQSLSNTVAVDQPFGFFFPTAFSPNHDGLNDVFRAVGPAYASKFTLQVLNRWGQIIFESTTPTQGWDGTYGGKPAPPGGYLYRLEAIDINGQRITKSGTVTLVR